MTDREKCLKAYAIFSLCLFWWTFLSVQHEIQSTYFISLMILGGVFLICCLLMENIGLMIICFFLNIGLSVAYRCGNTDSYAKDLVIMLIVFIVVYLIIRFTVVYRLNGINQLITAALPIILLLARIFGREVNGSYIYFMGFMIFGWILMGFPFMAAWFTSMNEDKYLEGDVREISWNMLKFLIFCFFIYAGCIVCNEYGILLIVGITATGLFLIRCRSYRAKIFYSVLCLGGMFLILFVLKVSHIRQRIQIWLDPAAAYGNLDLEGQAESVLYMFRHLNQIGFWGKGIGNLPVAFYPTLNTDHVLVLIINDYSILLFAIVIVLGIVFVRWMLKPGKQMEVYDRYLNQTCGLIVTLIILLDVASNLGSFITAGIGFPWISDGGSVNVMLTSLVAVHCAILDKGEVEECSD